MTSPQLTDPKPPIDAVESLRVLVTDLRALAGRLELKDQGRSLQQRLKATQERVSGPRAVVMLLSEHEDLKRRFFERLLGPTVAQLPNPTAMCTRLEYGADPECTVTMPLGLTAVLPLDQLKDFLDRHKMETTIQAIRLPNPTLKDDLAVIDTPVVKDGEPAAAASVLECAEQADACIFVLHPDHELSDASQEILRRLPERGARLEMVVEGAEVLTAEERLAARERLMDTLRERCNVETPRLTLVASAATEGNAETFWQGRFATFHSIMMLRGRERWMEATLAAVMDAISEVGAEIDCELKGIGLGLRHARLRLGMKDLDGLRTRFHELGRLDTRRPPDAEPPTAKAAEAGQEEIRSGVASLPAGELIATALPPVIAPAAPQIAAAAIGETSTNAAPPFALPAPLAEPAFASFRRSSAEPHSKRGLSVNFSEKVTRLIEHTKGVESGKTTLPKRIAGVALAVAFVCLILWALAPRGSFFGHDAPSEWEYQPSPKQLTARGVIPAASPTPSVSLPKPEDSRSLPDAAAAEVPGIPVAPLSRRRAAIRMPLLRPSPSGATAGVPHPAKRHHRHLLGLGKLWHWVRHGHGKHPPNNQ